MHPRLMIRLSDNMRIDQLNKCYRLGHEINVVNGVGVYNIVNENSYKYHVLYYDATTGDYLGKVKFHVGKTVL